MNRRACLVSLPAAALVFSQSGCSREHSYLFRYTLVVDDNGTERVGSSVVEIGEYRGYGLTGNGYRPNIKGQGVVVDMGAGRLLVGTLDRPTGRLLRFYNLPSMGHGDGAGSLALLAHQRGEMTVAAKDLVTLVTFGDNADPRTAREVKPDALDKAFGPGVRLERATIEVTSDPVTTGITKRLPWLTLNRNYIDGGTSTFNSVGFRTDQFVSGVK